MTIIIAIIDFCQPLLSATVTHYQILRSMIYEYCGIRIFKQMFSQNIMINILVNNVNQNQTTMIHDCKSMMITL